MATYKGFSTINKHKKFTLTDRDLVIRDLTNMLNIREGSLPGRPEYGTTIWNYLFEPNTLELERRITKEIRRLIDTDPRILLEDLEYHSEENGIVMKIGVRILPDVNIQVLQVMFDADTTSAKVR